MALAVGTNSYIDVTDADAFFEERLHSANWTDAETADKTKALIMATRMINENFSWQGDLSDEAQSLAWPRADVFDLEGREIDSVAIPGAIEIATCEQAIYLLGLDPTQKPELIQQGFSKGGMGKMQIETDKTMVADMIAPAVFIAVGILGNAKSSATAGGSGSCQIIRN